MLTPAGGRAAYAAGPDTGGTKVRLLGHGFQNALTETRAGLADISFVDVGVGLGFSSTTTFNLLSASSTVITFDTPADNPGLDAVSYCNVSGCAPPPPNGGLYTYYPPGNPSLSSSSPRSGNKGTVVTLHGANLGFPVAVYFGSVKDTNILTQPSLLDSGSTTAVLVVAPAGTAGKKVDLRLVTVESEATGYGKSHLDPSVTFTFTKAKKK